MAVGDGVEEDRPAGLDAADEPELLEELERRVDRRQRQPGQPLAGGARELLGGGVAAEPAERLEQHDALARDAQAARAQRVGQAVGRGRGAHRRMQMLGHPSLK